MREHKTEILTRMIRRSGISKNEVARLMGISVPTLRKYIACPDHMNGIRRKQLARILSIDITVIDAISNHPNTVSIKEAQQLIELIKPQNQ